MQYTVFFSNFKGFWEPNESLLNQCQEIRIDQNLLKLRLRTGVQKKQRSDMKVVVTEGEIWFLKNIFEKILEPNYLYSYQHKTVVFTVTIRITLFHSLFIKVWKTIFYFYILFMFKVIMRLVLIKALLKLDFLFNSTVLIYVKMPFV